MISVIPLSKAIELTLNSPKEVTFDSPFTVEIDADTQITHDVKIYTHTSKEDKVTRKQYSSEIENEDWQDSWFYIKEAFPNQKEFNLRITDYEEEQTICVRLRDSETKKTHTKCDPILVIELPKSEEQDITPQEDPDDEEPEEIEEDIVQIPQTQQVIPTTLKNLSYEKLKPEKIVLNPPPEQIVENELFKTNQEKKRMGIIYAFTIFITFLLVLLILRKL